MIFSEMKFLCYKVNKHKHFRLMTRLFHATCIAHSDLKTFEQCFLINSDFLWRCMLLL